MNPSIRKELENCANPTCNRTVTRCPDGTWCIMIDHPIIGLVDIDGYYDTEAEAQLIMESMSVVDEDTDVDLEIEAGADVFAEVTDSEWLSNNRDVPSKVALDPSWEEGISAGDRPLMKLVRHEAE